MCHPICLLLLRNPDVHSHVQGHPVEDYSSIPSAIIERGFKLKLLREEELNLKTAFMMLTKGKQ